MIVLHGTWNPSETIENRGNFFLWGESSSGTPIMRKGRPPKIRDHPFQVNEKILFKVIESLDPENGKKMRLENVTCLLPSYSKSSKDIKTHCSCPDRANPCKHIAAVYYILAEEFDNDPFMLFKLRGRTREEITILLRKKRTIGLKSQDNLEDISCSKTIEQKEDAIFSLDTFWSGEEIDSFSVNISLPEVSTAIIKRLGTPQFWDSKENFIEIMSEF